MSSTAAGICAGKTRFATFADARKQARQRLRLVVGAKLGPYHCGPCNAYHIGTHFQIKRPTAHRRRPERFEDGDD